MWKNPSKLNFEDLTCWRGAARPRSEAQQRADASPGKTGTEAAPGASHTSSSCRSEGSEDVLLAPHNTCPQAPHPSSPTGPKPCVTGNSWRMGWTGAVARGQSGGARYPVLWSQCPPQDVHAGSQRERRCSAQDSPCLATLPPGCRAFKKGFWSVGVLGTCADFRKEQKKGEEIWKKKKKKAVRKESSRKWEEGKNSRMISKIGRWNNYY